MNARPHAASATAANDPLGVPRGYLLVSLLSSLAVFRVQKADISARGRVSQTDDHFYAQVHLKSPANIILSTSSTSKTFSGKAGINRVSMPLVVGSGIKCQVVSVFAVDWFFLLVVCADDIVCACVLLVHRSGGRRR